MLTDILAVSLTMSLIIILLLILTPFISPRYKAKCKYLAWMFVAIRLIIPYRIDLPDAPVRITDPGFDFIMDMPIVNDAETEQIIPDNNDMVSNEAITEHKSVTPHIVSLGEVIFAVWLTIAILFLLYHITALIVFRYKTSKSKVHIKDNVYKTPLVKSPMMTGFFKPTILIPDIELSEDELDMVILHESTHFKRKDIWYKLLLVIANSIHWFNPIVYLMVKQANRDLEYSCDDIVTSNMDLNEKKAYSKTILKFMEQK